MNKCGNLKIGFLACAALAAVATAAAAAAAAGAGQGQGLGPPRAAGPAPIRDGRPVDLNDRGFLASHWAIKEVRKDKVYIIPGGGDISTVIIGDKGVIIVDPKTTRSAGEQLIKDVATLTSKPITHVIETHSDCDHVNGIVAFPTSVQVIAHVNNRFEQEEIARLATVEIDGGHGVSPQDRLPNVLITKNGETATINGVPLVFYHWGPGHTNGDLMIYLPTEKVMVAGDIIPDSGRGLASFKFEKSGSTYGWFKNAEGMLASDANVFVAGHGQDWITREDFQGRVDQFRAKMDKVDAIIGKGKSLEDTVKEMGEQLPSPTANGLAGANVIKECPRGISGVGDTWIRWHEWNDRNASLGAMVAAGKH